MRLERSNGSPADGTGSLRPDGFRDEDPPMDDATYFERLAANVSRLARHPTFPAKQQAVDLCLEDIDDLSLAGRITAEQADALRATLLRLVCQAA